MILQSEPKQLMLTDDGQILWQADASNPLPGIPVAVLAKGAAQLKPEVTLLESATVEGQDQAALIDFIKAWLDQRINTVLEPLMALVKEEGIEGPARGIADQLHEALGIMPRHDLEELIAGLDADARKALRQRKVRLGPVLVFVPELNKPAAIRLRALLWWLWHDRVLPAPLPKDGVVSVLIADGVSYDPDYQRAIGYPVYGGRAIRVDMLDRLISAIYDNAKDGTFKASHAMAEWMGCSIPDLYKIIESMGHRKISEPPEVKEETKEDIKEDIKPEDAPQAESAAPQGDEPVAVPVAQAAPPKPELATFRLKRGKAHEAARPPRTAPHRGDGKIKDNKPAQGKKPSSSRTQDKPREKARRGKVEKFEKKPTSFEARPDHVEESPFAILQQLKAGMKEK